MQGDWEELIHEIILGIRTGSLEKIERMLDEAGLSLKSIHRELPPGNIQVAQQIFEDCYFD